MVDKKSKQPKKKLNGYPAVTLRRSCAGSCAGCRGRRPLHRAPCGTSKSACDARMTYPTSVRTDIGRSRDQHYFTDYRHPICDLFSELPSHAIPRGPGATATGTGVAKGGGRLRVAVTRRRSEICEARPSPFPLCSPLVLPEPTRAHARTSSTSTVCKIRPPKINVHGSCAFCTS